MRENSENNGFDFDLTADDLVQTSPDEPLEIPERPKNGKPGIVFISELPAGEVIRLSKSKNDSGDWLFELISKAVKDRNGNLIFSEPQARRLQDTSIAVFNRLQNAVLAKNPLKSEGESPLEKTTTLDQPTESVTN